MVAGAWRGGAGAFFNPGRTSGLKGRKRDLSEGGIREIGLVEAPWLVRRNGEEASFPFATMDLMPTVLDLLGMASFQGRPLDGASLVPYHLLLLLFLLLHPAAPIPSSLLLWLLWWLLWC